MSTIDRSLSRMHKEDDRPRKNQREWRRPKREVRAYTTPLSFCPSNTRGKSGLRQGVSRAAVCRWTRTPGTNHSRTGTTTAINRLLIDSNTSTSGLRAPDQNISAWPPIIAHSEKCLRTECGGIQGGENPYSYLRARSLDRLPMCRGVLEFDRAAYTRTPQRRRPSKYGHCNLGVKQTRSS